MLRVMAVPEGKKPVKGKKPRQGKKLQKQTTFAKMEPGAEGKVLIYVDARERASSVVQELMKHDAIIKVKQLDTGDYILSDEVAVERKTVADFLQSIIDGRLFNQVITLASNFEKPLLLVEGQMHEIFSLRNIHRNAIIGALTSIALNYRMPLLFTRDAEETAEFLYVTAKREQLGKDKAIRLRIGRKGFTLQTQQQFIVESLPMVGPGMARKLLEEFGSVKAIANATSTELQKVEGLGSKKAHGIKKVFWGEYKKGKVGGWRTLENGN